MMKYVYMKVLLMEAWHVVRVGVRRWIKWGDKQFASMLVVICVGPVC